MVEGRILKNKFAEELINCLENDTNGTSVIFLRFEIYINQLSNQIKDTNTEIEEELNKIFDEEKNTFKHRPDIYNSLNYFNDLLLKTIFISSYSYLELKLSEISSICESEIPEIKNIKSFKKNISYVESFLKFLNSEVISIPNFSVFFSSIKHWKDLRNFLVHNKSLESLPPKKFLEDNFIQVLNYELVFLNKQAILNFINFSAELISLIKEEIEIKYKLVEHFKN